MEYFDSKNEMNEYFDHAKERAARMKEAFKEKYAGSVNCDALFEDMKNMYMKEKSTESILSLGDRGEYRNVDKTDLSDLIGVFAFEYGQIPRERERYTFKNDSGPGNERDIEPDLK